MRIVERDFYRRPACDVARDLLNKLLWADGRAGRIVEVEAYAGQDDPGSHAYRGKTRRNATMFGPPGHLYVYLIYGVHWCSNAVCGDDGFGTAVLIRALAPTHGVEAMKASRPQARRERDLCSGPAKLCQSLGIDGGDDGSDLVTGDRRILVYDDGTPPPERLGESRRVGLSRGVELPWRYYVPGDPNLSRPG